MADARLYHRDDLEAKLSIGSSMGDGPLLLKALQQWGPEAGKHLRGDFAAALWNPRRRELRCIRDHFGVRPLYVVDELDFVAVASDTRMLRAIPGVGNELNELVIGDFLLGMLDEPDSTVYRDIRRFPPAHGMTVSDGSIQWHRYWSLDPEPTTRYSSLSHYREAFRERFDKAVISRLRGPGKAGGLLSGGLDSSSIAVVAARARAQRNEKPFSTISAIFPGSPMDEENYIKAVTRDRHIIPHYIRCSTSEIGDRLETMLAIQDQPFFAPNWPMGWELLEAAQAKGVTVLLDGFDGDSVVSHGFSRLGDLARRNRLAALVTNLYGMGRMYPEASFWELWWPYLRMTLPGRVTNRLISRVISSFQPSKRSATEHPLRFLEKGFRETHNFDDRWSEWVRHLPQRARTARAEHFRILTRGLQSRALEVMALENRYFGIEARYPFWDVDLVEFCLSLPDDLKLRRGWSRFILRTAMQGMLPPSVQWRRGKTDFFDHFLTTQKALANCGLAGYYLNETKSHSFVNSSAVNRLWTELNSEGKQPELHLNLDRLITLGVWLASRSKLKKSTALLPLS